MATEHYLELRPSSLPEKLAYLRGLEDEELIWWNPEPNAINSVPENVLDYITELQRANPDARIGVTVGSPRTPRPPVWTDHKGTGRARRRWPWWLRVHREQRERARRRRSA